MSESGDIGKQQVAAVYAKALIGASEKTGATDRLVEEMDSLVADVLDKFPGFEGTLSSPRLSPEEKIQLLSRVFGGRASDEMQTFLKVLCQHERLDCLREIRRAFRHQHNLLRNRVEVEVTTAQEVPDHLREQIVGTLQEKLGCEVQLLTKLDESLIGGLVVRVGDTVVDGSVRNQLAQMRAQAVQRIVEQIHDDGGRFVGLSTSP